MSEPEVVRYNGIYQDDEGVYVYYSDYEALAARVEELEKDRMELLEWRAAVTVSLGRPGGTFYEDVPGLIKRLREALECCADMLRRVDSGRATEAAIDFAMDAARAALQGPTDD